MLIHDAAAAVPGGTTPEGFLRLRARIGRTGLHEYRAEELGLPAPFGPGDRIRVYRPADEVFAPASMASFAAKPVTVDHPPAMVDATNWRRYAVGHSGEVVTADGEHLVADLFVADAAAAARARDGAELSNGYHADFVFEPGLTPDGEPYDAIQRNIRGNHIALVGAGRCGGSCRVGEDDPEGTAAGVALPLAEALPPRRAAGDAGPPCGCGDEAPVSHSAALDALVVERAGVIDAARRLLGPAFEAGGRPTAALRRLVVARRLGEEAVRARDDAYVAAAFDTLDALHPRGNPLAAQLSAARRPGGLHAALTARDTFLQGAWKGAPLQGEP